MHALLSAEALSLLFLAAVFQIVALVKIWLAFGHEGETPLGVVRGWLRRFSAELDRAGQRVGALVLRRRKAVVGSGAIAIGAAFNARVRIQFGLLPAGSNGALAELDRRTKELMERVSDEKERREDEAGSIRREIDDVRAQTARDIEALRERDRRVATHGLGWELAGLACTVFALICQAASTIVTT